MKLLFANHHMRDLAGSELHTADLCRGFRRAGHEVSLFTLIPGAVSEALSSEGFRVYGPDSFVTLAEEAFDLVYLHHSTCEAILGAVCGGRVPVVRGYLGHLPDLEHPLPGSRRLQGALFKSEEDLGAMGAPEGVPFLIARNVYDDAVVPELPERPPFAEPALAVVTNHLDPGLSEVLEEAARGGLCSWTHFGLPYGSTPVTAELLAGFDAVVSIGRTVVQAAALGKPVYVCDVHGSDGWLRPSTYRDVQRHGFSGRYLGRRDPACIRDELLDRQAWPSPEDLRRLQGWVAKDHALSGRVRELGAFFSDLAWRHNGPPNPGQRAVARWVQDGARDSLSMRRHAEDLEQEVNRLQESYERQEEALQNARERMAAQRARNQELRSRLEKLKASKVWRLAEGIRTVRAGVAALRSKASR